MGMSLHCVPIASIFRKIRQICISIAVFAMVMVTVMLMLTHTLVPLSLLHLIHQCTTPTHRPPTSGGSSPKHHTRPRSPCTRRSPSCLDPGETLQEVVFRVTNYADPSNPRITEDFVRRCLCGERPHSAAPNGVSEGLGLQHIFMAATAVGMQVLLVQEADLVMFTLTTKAQVVGQGPARNLSASPVPLAVPAGLTFCCIDDNAIARLLVTSAIQKGFPQSTVRQYGERLEDVADFTEAVAAGADVAILDQNLEFESQTVLGSDLVRELIANGYLGLLCIRSANDSESDQALYRASGAHCFLDKGLAPAEMVRQVTSAYWSNEVCTAEARSSSELLQAEGAGASQERQERYKAPLRRARRFSKAVQPRTFDTLPGLVSHRSSSFTGTNSVGTV